VGVLSLVCGLAREEARLGRHLGRWGECELGSRVLSRRLVSRFGCWGCVGGACAYLVAEGEWIPWGRGAIVGYALRVLRALRVLLGDGGALRVESVLCAVCGWAGIPLTPVVGATVLGLHFNVLVYEGCLHWFLLLVGRSYWEGVGGSGVAARAA
jgi:hypothetical protein